MEKILVISTMYPSHKHPAFGVFIKNQVKALEKRGIHVDVAAVKEPRTQKRFVVMKYVIWIVRITFKLLTTGRQYDVIHAHYVYPSGRLALLFKKWFGTRVIVTAHGGDLDKMAKKGRFYFNQTKQVLHEADHVIAVGEQLKQDMETTFHVNPDNILLLNMGVNRQIFSPVNQWEARQTLNVSPSSTILLFAGNIIKAKGVAELVDAYSELKKSHPNLELHLIGAQKEPAFLRWLKDKIADNGIRDISIHPPMNQKDIATWMAAADVFVIPSYIEGFGLVALEAMSCHTPVVGSNVGGLRYLLKDNAGVLVEPKSQASLRKGIESILTDDTFQNELIANGEDKAKAYNQERLIEQLIQLYHRE